MPGEGLLAGKRGQAAVETALILPIIVLILMAMIDFGLVLNHYLVIANASREGARSAAIGARDSEVTALVAKASSTLDQTKLVTRIYPSESLRKKGDEVIVTIEFKNQLITPLISALVPNPFILRAKTVMRIE